MPGYTAGSWGGGESPDGLCRRESSCCHLACQGTWRARCLHGNLVPMCGPLVSGVPQAKPERGPAVRTGRPFCWCLCCLPVRSGSHQPLIKRESSSPHLPVTLPVPGPSDPPGAWRREALLPQAPRPGLEQMRGSPSVTRSWDSARPFSLYLRRVRTRADARGSDEFGVWLQRQLEPLEQWSAGNSCTASCRSDRYIKDHGSSL